MGLKTYQTQWAAQFYVAAELTRKGYLVSFTLGNAPKTDLMVANQDGTKPFRIDVKGQSTRNFWLFKKTEPKDNLYYILVYLPDEGSPEFSILTSIEMMKERDMYEKHIKSTTGNYKDELGGFNWSTRNKYLDKWDKLPI